MNKLLIFVFALLALVASAGQLRAKNTPTLWYGESLKSGEYLKSKSGQYYASLEVGTFAVYRAKDFSPKNLVWMAYIQTKQRSPWRLSMQTDGNVVVYDSANYAVWNTQTAGKGVSGHHLDMQDDGNLVLYDGSGRALWDSKGYVRS